MTWTYLLGVMTGFGLLDVVRRIGMVAWASIFLPIGKPLWRVLRGRSQFYDLLWCTWAGVAFLILMFGVRAIYAPDSPTIYAGLHILSAIVAVSCFVVVKSYMTALRGGRA